MIICDQQRYCFSRIIPMIANTSCLSIAEPFRESCCGRSSRRMRNFPLSKSQCVALSGLDRPLKIG
jgi:hypothetical protein